LLISLSDEGSNLVVDYNLSLPALAQRTIRACPSGFCVCTAGVVAKALNIADALLPPSSYDNKWYDTKLFARVLLPIKGKLDQDTRHITLGDNTICFAGSLRGVFVAHNRLPSLLYAIPLKDVCDTCRGCVVFKFLPNRLGFWYQFLDTDPNDVLDRVDETSDSNFVFRHSGLTHVHSEQEHYCYFDFSLSFLFELAGLTRRLDPGIKVCPIVDTSFRDEIDILPYEKSKSRPLHML
jgi:hypothetical protein